MNESFKIRRQDLYNLVWTRPMRQVAKEYNLSDVGLAKICRKNSIPLPPVGYWTKVAYGHTVKMTPLPPLGEGILDTIEILQKDLSPLDGIKTKADFDRMIVATTGKHFVQADKFKKELHSLVVESQKEFRDRLKSYKNLHDGDRLNVHNIAVTKSSIERALSLMNMLFQVLELNGLPISRKPGYGGGTYVKTNGRDVQVALKERTTRSENPDPKSYNKYEFHPTGILYFEVENIYVNGVRKTWNDSQSRKLENTINEVGIGIIVAAILDKKRDEERAEINKIEEAEREKKRSEEEHRQKEKERFDSLLNDVQKWNTIRILREYIKEAEEKCASLTPKPADKSEFETWIRWANQKANEMDPILKSFWNSKS